MKISALLIMLAFCFLTQQILTGVSYEEIPEFGLKCDYKNWWFESINCKFFALKAGAPELVALRYNCISLNINGVNTGYCGDSMIYGNEEHLD